jgi:hypothetical protein
VFLSSDCYHLRFEILKIFTLDDTAIQDMATIRPASPFESSPFDKYMKVDFTNNCTAVSEVICLADLNLDALPSDLLRKIEGARESITSLCLHDKLWRTGKKSGSHIKPEMLQRVTKFFGNTKSLILAGFTFLPNALQCLTNLKLLEELSLLNSQKLIATEFQILAAHLSMLRVLNLCQTSVTDEHIKALGACKSLRVLYINTCPEVRDLGLMHLINNCKTVQTIHAKACNNISLFFMAWVKDKNVQVLTQGEKENTPVNFVVPKQVALQTISPIQVPKAIAVPAKASAPPASTTQVSPSQPGLTVLFSQLHVAAVEKSFTPIELIPISSVAPIARYTFSPSPAKIEHKDDGKSPELTPISLSISPLSSSPVISEYRLKNIELRSENLSSISCKETIATLHIEGCIFLEKCFDGLVGFKSLKHVVIAKSKHADHYAICNLITNCPQLELLEIENFTGTNCTLACCLVTCKNLKELKLTNCQKRKLKSEMVCFFLGKKDSKLVNKILVV